MAIEAEVCLVWEQNVVERRKTINHLVNEVELHQLPAIIALTIACRSGDRNICAL